MRGEVGKETNQKEMDFYDVTRDILGFLFHVISVILTDLLKYFTFLH